LGRHEDQIWQDLVYKGKSAHVRGPAIVALTTKGYFIRKFLRPDRHDHLLDIGCGYGEFTQLAARRAGEVLGVDAAETAVAAAKVAARQLGATNVRFAVGSAYELAGTVGDPGSFDKIICFDLLEHLGEPEKVVAKIHDLLRPGGRALIYTNCYGRFSWAYLQELWRTGGRPRALWTPDKRDHHLQRFTTKRLRELTTPFRARFIYKNHFLIPLASWVSRTLDRLIVRRPPLRETGDDSTESAVTVQTSMRAPRRLVEAAKLGVSILEMQTLGRILPAAGVYLLLEKR